MTIADAISQYADKPEPQPETLRMVKWSDIFIYHTTLGLSVPQCMAYAVKLSQLKTVTLSRTQSLIPWGNEQGFIVKSETVRK